MKRKNISLLFLGLEGSGKTTLVRKLAKEDLDDVSVTPTHGLNTTYFKFGDFNIEALDVGGGEFTNIWSQYYADVHGLVFCVDSRDKAKKGDAAAALREVLSHPKMVNKPAMVMYTKLDADPTFGNAEFDYPNLSFNQSVQQRGCITPQDADKKLQKTFHGFLGKIRKIFAALNKRVNADLEERAELRQKEAKERFERVKKRREEQERLEKESAEAAKASKFDAGEATKTSKSVEAGEATKSRKVPKAAEANEAAETEPFTLSNLSTPTTANSTATTSSKSTMDVPATTVAQLAMGEFTITLNMDLSNLIAEMASVDNIVRAVEATITRTTKPTIAPTTVLTKPVIHTQPAKTIKPAKTINPGPAKSTKPTMNTREEATVINIETDEITVVYKKKPSSRRRSALKLFRRRVKPEVKTTAKSEN